MHFAAFESSHEEDLKLLSFGKNGPKVGGAKRNINEHLPPPRMIMNNSREEACMCKCPWKVAMLCEQC
jgi:hypothetical protein